jgi:acetolactate synthase-1/2/3 large subunit
MKHLQEAKRPVIWAGHGVRIAGMREEFNQLVSKLQIPVILTWSGIDLLPDTHPLYFGRAGVSGMRHSNFIIQNCDFLLVLGSRLSILQTGYDINQFAPHAKIAVVDTDSVEWTKHPSDKYARIIHMDCRVFIPDLTKYSSPCDVPDWLTYCTKMKNKYPLLEECHSDGGPHYLNSYRFLDKLCDYIDDDAIIVTDMGTALLSGHYSMRMKPDQRMFTSLGLGEMGYGLPGAIGAAKAFPGRQIICLNCDGGMMMNLQELQTIVYHNLPIKIVVFNNDGYLMIKHTQKMLFKDRRTAVDTKTGVGLPNFMNVANGFGIRTYAIDNWNSFGVVNDWLNKKDPALLNVFMNPEQDFVPKVKGVTNEDGTITPALLEEMSPLLPYKDIEEAMIAGVNEKSKRIIRP